MAITVTNLDSKVTTTDNASTATSNSITLTANAIIVAHVSFINTGGVAATVSSVANTSGLIWTRVGTGILHSGTQMRGEMYWALTGGSPVTSQTITFTYSAATTDAATVVVDALQGLNTTTPFAQFATGSTTGSPVTATLSAFANANNGTYAGVYCFSGSNDPAVGSGFTQVGAVQGEGSRLLTEFKTANDTSVDATNASGSALMSIIGVEVNAVAAVNGTATPAAIAVSVSIPTVTKLAVSTITPSPITVSSSIPQALASGSSGIAASPLTSSGDAVDNTVFVTDSISPSTNALVLLFVQSGLAAFETPGDPTVTGCGLTWVLATPRVPDASGVHHTYLFRAMGTPTPGAVTIDFDTETQVYCWYSINQFVGVDTGGTNGSAAVVQVANNTATSTSTLTVTLAAFGDAANATYGGFGSPALRTYTPGSGFTELGEAGTTPGQGSVQTEWRTGNDTSVDVTISSSSTITGIAAELKAASTGSSATATPNAIAVAVSIPAVTKLAESVIIPSPLLASIAVPAVTKLAVSTITPPAIAVPVTVPQVLASGAGTGTAVPVAIAVMVSIPAVTTNADAIATPQPINVTVAVPTPTLTATANIVPDPFSVVVTIPQVGTTGNVQGTATPAPITVGVSFASYTITNPRAFTPPARIENPPVLPSSKGPARALFRHYRARPAGRNVFIMNDGSVTENDPVTTYNPDGTIDEEAWDRVDEVFWGGHDAQFVSDDHIAALEAAGYTVGIDALVGS